MAGDVLDFERDYGFAPAVVWDALVDADLVSGWLADAEIDPRIGGRYDLAWHAPLGLGRTAGEVADLLERETLVVEIERLGTATFALVALDGGDRLATRLRITLDSPVERRLSSGLRATVLMALEHLDELLRGRPVDWSRWDELHGADWAAHRERESIRAKIR